MKPKKATPKTAEVNEVPNERQIIADLSKALLESNAAQTRLRHNYNELKQDYLELTEQIAASATTAKRILFRHSIGRSSTFTQGVKTNQGGQ